MTVSIKVKLSECLEKKVKKMEAKQKGPASRSCNVSNRKPFYSPSPSPRQLLVQCLVWCLFEVKLERNKLLGKSTSKNKPYLNQNTTTETSFHKRLGHPTGCICSWSVHLCVVFSRESTASMGSPTTIRIHNDLSTGNTSITLNQ